MKFERALEIIESKGVIEVDYKGQPIWINSIDDEYGLAEVSVIDSEDNNRVVKIEELEER